MARKRQKIPLRLDAKPTRPHDGKKGTRGYRRSRAKTQLRRDLSANGGMGK
jgi:hypothetical protein